VATTVGKLETVSPVNLGTLYQGGVASVADPGEHPGGHDTFVGLPKFDDGSDVIDINDMVLGSMKPFVFNPGTGADGHRHP
jgi:hypothetical protein